MKDNTREIGGSTMALWRGRMNGRIASFFQRRSDKLMKKGNKTIVSNPTCKFINPFTMIFHFTVDNSEKYQLVHQGDFKEFYREWRQKLEDHAEKMVQYEANLEAYEAEENKEGFTMPVAPPNVEELGPLEVDKMFIIILSKGSDWYKKE